MKIFWSWQSDTPGKIGRFLVRDALRDAIEELKQAADVEEPTREALHLDQDIQDVTGSPDLVRTIFSKIEASEVVVADVTLTGATGTGKKLTNSNVAIELGYALHARTDKNVLLVFNDHYGKHEDLPFDLRHKGGAIVFNLAPDAERAVIEAQRKALKGQLTRALKPFLARPVSGALDSLGEVRFDYPGSPWDRWEFRSDNPQDDSPPRFSSPTDHAGGMIMTAPASHHLDLKPDPHHRVCNCLKFQMKLTRDCPGSYVYLMVQVTSKDRKTVVKSAWIACDVGNKPPAKHGPSEWIIYGKPSANGWTEFDLRLPDEIEKSCFGQEEGLEFGELLSVRLRGSVSVSPIELYRQPAL